MMLLGKSQQAEWVGRSHIIADFIDFDKPFDVLLCSKAIHNVLVSTCENHFSGKCSSVDDTRKGFFEIKKPVLDGSLLKIEIDQLIGKLGSRAMVEDKLAALHVTEDFVAAIYGSDERNVALIVAPAYYEASTSTINDNTLIEKPAESFSTESKALIDFFKENCCGVGGGFIGSGTRTGGLNPKVRLHDSTPFKDIHPTSSKSTQQAEKGTVMAEATLTLSTDARELTDLLAKLSAKQKVIKSEAFAERFQFLLDAGKILSPGAVKNSDSATSTGELFVPLKPSNALLSLASAFLAGNGDFEVFDHEYSFSVNPNTQHSRGDNS